MDATTILEHLNAHHTSDLANLCKKFDNAKEVTSVFARSVDLCGLDLVYNNVRSLRVEFPQKASESNLKDAIIALCMSAKSPQLEIIKDEIQNFKSSFGSVILASVDSSGFPVASYAPLIQLKNECYIYISEVAEHFHSIKANPSKVEALFLEDECKAKSVILRKRLRYKLEAKFIKRDSDEFNAALDSLESNMGGSGGIKTIRQMSDFHLIRLVLKKGRFVKGFGQAYDILENGEILQVGANEANPHSKNPHNINNPHNMESK